MSASAPRQQLKNPAELFIKWRGGEDQGYFEYYDKSIKDEKLRNVKIDLSEGFAILDEDLMSITGYDDRRRMGIISNEVRTINDKLIVKGYIKGQNPTTLLSGPYSELKETVKESNIYNYTKNIYIMLRDGRLAHLALSGSSFRQWLSDVQPNSNHGKCWIRHDETKDAKNGNVKYKFPVFKVGEEISPSDWEEVVNMDGEILQPYLEKYLEKNLSGRPETHEDIKEEIDTSKWREQKTKDGRIIGKMSMDDIRQHGENLIEEGFGDSDEYQYIAHALFDFQQASKTWEDKKTKSGKLLKEHSLSELKDILSRIPMENPYRLYVEAGVEALEATQSEDEPSEFEDDDIPF